MEIYNVLFSRTYVLKAEKYVPIGVLKMDFVLVAYVIATLIILLHTQVLTVQSAHAQLQAHTIMPLHHLVWPFVRLAIMQMFNLELVSPVIKVVFIAGMNLIFVQVVFQHLLILNIMTNPPLHVWVAAPLAHFYQLILVFCVVQLVQPVTLLILLVLLALILYTIWTNWLSAAQLVLEPMINMMRLAWHVDKHAPIPFTWMAAAA